MKSSKFYTIWLTAIMLAGYSSSGQCAADVEPIRSELPNGHGKHELHVSVHIVQKGDTLYGIASNYGFDYHELAKLNGIQNPGNISIGQKIRLFHGSAASFVQPLESNPAESLIKQQPKAVKYAYPDVAVAQIGQVPAEATQKVGGSQKSSKTKRLTAIRGMEKRWVLIQETIHPKILVRLCKEFKRDYPDAKHTSEVEKILKGARRALKSQLVAELADDTLEILADEAHVRDDLVKALRGDKDSAYRIALMYREGNNGLLKNTRRVEQWLKFSAELGNGIASWQLAELYLSTGQQADAAKYERHAIDLGYVPPPRLSNRGY